MIGRVDHVAIAVVDVEGAAATYRDLLGARVSEPKALLKQGVRVVFVELDNTRIELMEPLGDASPIAAFLERKPDGGLHHVCYEVDDIIAARDHLLGGGARILGDGQPLMGAHGKRVLFVHPKDLCGTLVELQEA
jgi:methylmalonyl-CoA/ethylmalonyl-CoA epimerase